MMLAELSHSPETKVNGVFTPTQKSTQVNSISNETLYNFLKKIEKNNFKSSK